MREAEARAALGLDDIAGVLAPDRPRAIPEGYDDTYRDFTDYILRCTHRIWEGRGIGLIATHYAADAQVWTPSGLIRGAEAMTAGTILNLASFPDRTLHGEAVVSSEWDGGLLSSHRILSAMTHRADNEFGPATGRQVRVRTVADCWAVANRIGREWLLRDNLGIVRQLGLEPAEVAARMGFPSDPAFRDWRAAEMARVRAGTSFPGRAPEAAEERAVAEAWTAAWNEHLFGPLRALCLPGIVAHVPGSRRIVGREAVTGWIIERLAALPDARVTVDHAGSVPLRGTTEVGLRWSLAGTHRDSGPFGQPSGREVHLVAALHARLFEGRATELWIIADELAVLRQVLA